MMQTATAEDGAGSTVIFQGATHYAPFYYQDGGHYVGFDIELFRAVAAEADLSVIYQFGNWGATQRALAAGRIDVVPMFESPERREQYIFTDPILIEHHLLFGPVEAASHRSLDSLAGHTVAAENNAHALQELRRLGVDAELVGTDSEAEALLSVAEGEADFALVPTHVGYYVIEQYQLEGITALSPPLLPVAYSYAVNPARPELAVAINEALITLQRNGVRKGLQETWLSDYNPGNLRLEMLQYLWVIPVLLVITVLSLVGLWIYRRKMHHFRLTTNRKLAAMRSINEITGLPRRHYFIESLDRLLALPREQDQSMVIGVMSITDLEYLQHVVGDPVIDSLLKQSAENLKKRIPELVGYIGQGQFAFVLTGIEGREDALQRVHNIVNDVSYAYEIQDQVINIEMITGLAFYPDHARTAAELLRKAKLAMHYARTQHDSILIYDSAFEPDISNLALMNDLKNALADYQLIWLFQPQYNREEQRVTGAEMLVRWNHAQRGWVPPEQFISLAEQTGLINLVTRQAVEKASTVLSQWLQESRGWTLSINVSARDLGDGRMVDYLIDKLGNYRSLATIEITETAFMQDIEAIIANIERIKRAGIRIALDDYGTGYSSMNYLKLFNIDEIKIDRAFIRHLRVSERDMKLTQASITLAHELNALIVAEGVEDEQTAMLLYDLGCDVVQGYGIAKPMSLEEFERFATDYVHKGSRQQAAWTRGRLY